jgi:hypothetical protein
MVRLVVSVELFDDEDKVVDRMSEDVEVSSGGGPNGDRLDASADIGEVSGNVWGDTPGSVWGHGSDRRTDPA